MDFDTKCLPEKPDDLAPDGSEVHLLCRLERGSMAHFTLPADRTSRPVVHQTVEEIWYVVGGEGEMWRKQGRTEEVISLPEAPLAAIGVTMPSWPGADEAQPAEGPWMPTT
jgi:mannose-6-phosphate isomerase-like protein (cupin superfamily)